MAKLLFFLLLIILFVVSCKERQLTKLTDEQYVERINANKLPKPNQIKRIDEFGNEITQDSLRTLSRKYPLAETVFVNSDREIREIHFKRKDPIELISINCKTQTSQLDSIKQLDQANRKIYNPKVDNSNLQFVISLIETCGMPEASGELNTIFLILQHNHSIYQKKYISLLKEKSSQGLIAKSKLAMMEDRISMNDRVPQVYGTQVYRSNGNEEWELYELLEPERVNERRREIGLGPIEDYLKSFDIHFEIEQAE